MMIDWNSKIKERTSMHLYCVSFIPHRELQFVINTTSEEEAMKLAFETFDKHYDFGEEYRTFDDFAGVSAAQEINMDFLAEVINRSIVDAYDAGNKVIALDVAWE